MRRFFTSIILCLLLATTSFAGTVTMPQYVTGDSVTADNQNLRFNNLTNEVNSGLNNLNADTANGFRFHEILGTLPANGIQGRTVFLTSNNTLNFDTGTAWITTAVLPNNQTFTGDNTFSGTTTFTTIDDLGVVDTADINGGTMDNVQVDGATATGMLYTNDASDDLSQLGAQGTTGQFLQSAGAGVNPVFANATRTELFLSDDTWPVPAGVTKAYLTMVAGGGGGGGDDGQGGTPGGGAGGAWIRNFVVTVTPTETLTLQIGVGGPGGAAGDNDGTDGEDTVFDVGGDAITVAGGNKGLKGTTSTGGAATGGDFDAAANVPGGYTGFSGAGGTGDGTTSGAGGGTPFGTGAVGVENSDGVAGAANTGVGGSGGEFSGSNQAGAAGGSGFILIVY